jgi:hypothetical protein
MDRCVVSLVLVLAFSNPSCLNHKIRPGTESDPEVSRSTRGPQTYSIGEYVVREADGHDQVLLVSPAYVGHSLRSGRVFVGPVDVTVTNPEGCSNWKPYAPRAGVKQVVFVGRSAPSTAAELDPSRSDRYILMYRYCPRSGEFNFDAPINKPSSW